MGAAFRVFIDLGNHEMFLNQTVTIQIEVGILASQIIGSMLPFAPRMSQL